MKDFPSEEVIMIDDSRLDYKTRRALQTLNGVLGQVGQPSMTVEITFSVTDTSGLKRAVFDYEDNLITWLEGEARSLALAEAVRRTGQAACSEGVENEIAVILKRAE